MNAAFAIGRLCDMDTGRQRLLALQDSEKMVSQALCRSVRHCVGQLGILLPPAPQHCPMSVIVVVPAGDSALPPVMHLVVPIRSTPP